MIKRLIYVESNQTNPYRNLAIEEALMDCCNPEECIFYLWQNEHTVVIGRNQNAWRECRTTKLEEDGGWLARRKSGGGAVYHDLGNLNFTFICSKDNYDVTRQMTVIQRALELTGIVSKLSGRNDILFEGKKISGSAFRQKGSCFCHHGTIMVNVDIEMLSKYLTVSREKMISKGIASVEARVENLTLRIPNITVEQLKKDLRLSCEEIYGQESHILELSSLDQEKLESYELFFSDWDWRYGQKIAFQKEFSKHFSWGELLFQIQVNKGKIIEIGLFTDALETEYFERLREYLKGIRYRRHEIIQAIDHSPIYNKSEIQLKKDILLWMEQEDI